MLDSDGSVLGVGNQLSGSFGITAQSFENLEVIGPRPYNARGWPFHKSRYEGEGLINGRRWVEDSAVGHDPNEARQDESGEGEGFWSGGQTGEPIGVVGMIRARILDVGIYEDIHVREKHIESVMPIPEPRLVVLCFESPRPIEVDPVAGVHAADGH